MKVSDRISSFTMHQKQAINNQFLKTGWILIDLPEPEIVFRIKSRLEVELKSLTKDADISLETYHEYVENDAIHNSRQVELTRLFRENSFGPEIIKEQIEFFKAFIGPDIAMQETPYLRITRPHKEQDNVGYHRDTTYGGSPFEVSVWIPFTDANLKNGISVLPGSNVRAESDYPAERKIHPTIEKGSPLHLAGFPYAPLVIQSDIESEMLKIPVTVGQALIFSLSTVHGSYINTSTTTRWSMDTRILNKFAPVDLSKRPYNYLTLSQSAVSEQADLYLKNQTSENSIS